MPLVITKDCQPAVSQGFTVAALPGGPWHLTLRSSNKKILVLHRNHTLGTLATYKFLLLRCMVQFVNHINC